MLHELGHGVYDLGFGDDSVATGATRSAHDRGDRLLFGGLANDREWLEAVLGVDAKTVLSSTSEASGAPRRRSFSSSRAGVLVMTGFERILYADPDGDLDTAGGSSSPGISS